MIHDSGHLRQALGIKHAVVAYRRRLERQPARVAALREAVQEALEVEATLAREEVATLAAPPQASVEVLDVDVLDRALRPEPLGGDALLELAVKAQKLGIERDPAGGSRSSAS